MKAKTSLVIGLIVIVFIGMFIGCESDRQKQDIAGNKSVQVATFSDTIESTNSTPYDEVANARKYDSLIYVWKEYTARLVLTNDSLQTKLFLANYKIEKVKYYVSIVNKNPSQIKYLKGWVIRAVQ